MKKAFSFWKLPTFVGVHKKTKSSEAEGFMRTSRSTPNLKEKSTTTSKGRVNFTRRQSEHSLTSLSSRNPELPATVTSLPGPPVPPRSVSHLQLHMQSSASEVVETKMKLRRSTSESKVDKDRRNSERAQRARSVHFDGNNQHEAENLNDSMKQISIIGKDNSTETKTIKKPLETNLDDLDLLPPPPPNGKRKVIVAQRPNSFIWNLKSKMKRKRMKSKSDDEGFESPTTPITPNGVDYPKLAPLANQEDLEEEEKHEIEVTKEAKSNGVPVQLNVEEKKKLLRKYPYFKLQINLLNGKDLLAMDRGGVSDPYVKCLHGQDKLFQSRPIPKTIHPTWNETFEVHIDNPFKPLTLQVFDKDMVGSDDFMGEATIELTELNLSKTEGMLLKLNDANNEDLIKKNKKRKSLGEVKLDVTMSPLTKEEMNELVTNSVSMATNPIAKRLSFGGGSLNLGDCSEVQLDQILRAEKIGKGGKGKHTTWSAIVHIVLVQARNLMAMDHGESSDPYCKISLGKERQKSKVISCTTNPKWREAFDLYWYEEMDDELEITIWDKDIGAKDDFMGRVLLDLRDLDKEVTHNLWRNVDNGEGSMNFLVTISGTTRGDSPSNLINWEEDLDQQKSEWIENYKFKKSFKAIKDVGHLMVKVLKAKGLASADLGGKSDPFAVVELCNDRFTTHTEYKTLAPTWQKVFQFDVKDIHDVLEITVYDEDKDHKCEFLGKVALPLLKIKNNERRWFMLKDKKLRKSAKGDNPQIYLEMFFVYNTVRASVRTFNPKQLKYEDRSDIKFKHSVFMRNVNRVKAATADFDPEVVLREIQSILNWENKPKTAGAFAGFLIGVYILEPWMITLGLLIPFLKNIIVLSVTGGWNAHGTDDEMEDDDEEDKNQSQDKDGEKKSLKEKMQAMQEITLMVQNGLGMLAHVLESCANVFNFCVPFLSWLAFFVLALVTCVLYYVPLRYLIMAWGTNKFTKKLLRPNAINNNELADFISRVPDNEELKSFKELPGSDEVSRLKQIAKKKISTDADII